MNQTTNPSPNRDAATLLILGLFFLVIGGLVLIGTYWARDDYRAVIVSLGSGLVLEAIGGGMLIVSKRIRRRQEVAN